MKQMSLFDTNEKTLIAKAEWHLFVDGAARNNPGPAGAGIYVIKNGEPVLKQGFFLGDKTNNQAEYLALILGICQVKSLMQPDDMLRIFSDSELLIRQMKGLYAVKNKELRILHDRAKKMLVSVHYSVQHVARALNAIADSLANDGIDKKIKIPANLVHHCYF
jgi:ribonuclease HI